MSTYELYLEISGEGACMAHVLGLPGCFAAGRSRDQAMARAPGAIGDYLAGLGRHGEAVEPPETIELVVVEEQALRGPFHPGDRAGLFGPDRRPLSRAEIERHLVLAAYNRADLLALVRGLPDTMLDWQQGSDGMNIRSIMAHIGRAELWYVSRITALDEPAPDWQKLPARRYLAQARAMVAERFRDLSDDELAAVTYPATSDADAGEPWSARKALRRLLEHEREHTAHIEEIMAAWREDLLARMAAARSRFVWSLLSLDEETLTDEPILEAEAQDDGQGSAWTAKDLLAHVAAWDGLYARRTGLIGQGRAAEIEGVEVDEYNTAEIVARRGWSLDEAIRALRAARNDYLFALAGLSDAEIQRQVRMPWGRRTRPATWARWRYRHDEGHTADLLRWRRRAAPPPAVSPKAIAMAALESGRQEMLATAALVAVEERQSRPVCGVWTLKDVLGHVADWEWYGVEKLGGGPSRRSLTIRFRGIQKWNEAHAAARRNQPWEEVWSDFQGARLAMGRLLEKMSQADLAQPFAVPWSDDWTVYRFFLLWLHHEREHAADLRLNLDLPHWPAKLKRFK